LAVVAVFWWTTRSPIPLTTPEDKMAIAVLPTADNSGDPQLQQAGIDLILADLFVHVMSDMPEVYVVSPLRLDGIARERGGSLTDTARDPKFAREVCEDADATVMLTSSLSRVGDRYVLTARLTQIENQELIGTFEANSSNPADIISDLSTGMKSAVQKRFLPSADEEPPAPPVTLSVEAYSHYVRGLDYMNVARWDSALEEFEAATQIDPEMGLAWSELACAYSFSEKPDAVVETTQLEAEKWMVDLTHKDRAWIELNSIWLRTGNGPAYIEQLDRFLVEYPDDRNAHFYGGLAEQWLNGNCVGATKWFEKAYELTPFYYPATKGLVDCYVEIGQPEKAVAALERYLAHDRAPANGKEWATDQLTAIRAAD